MCVCVWYHCVWSVDCVDSVLPTQLAGAVRTWYMLVYILISHMLVYIRDTPNFKCIHAPVATYTGFGQCGSVDMHYS